MFPGVCRELVGHDDARTGKCRRDDLPGGDGHRGRVLRLDHLERETGGVDIRAINGQGVLTVQTGGEREIDEVAVLDQRAGRVGQMPQQVVPGREGIEVNGLAGRQGNRIDRLVPGSDEAPIDCLPERDDDWVGVGDPDRGGRPGGKGQHRGRRLGSPGIVILVVPPSRVIEDLVGGPIHYPQIVPS